MRRGPFGRTRFRLSPVHYVSADGNASWAQSVNPANPCSPATAFAEAVAGDVVYFRGGTYEVGQSTTGWPWTFAWSPTNSGAPGSPITFRNYPGETPLVNGTVSGTNAGTWTGFNESTCVFGALSRPYITFDGFTVRANNGAKMATVLLYDSDYSVIQNCTFNGGTQLTGDGNNWEGLRVEDSSNFRLSNCTFYNYKSATNNHNTSGYKGYRNQYAVLENCEAYNCTDGLYLKGSHHDGTVRNNFVHNCHIGVLVTPDTVNMLTDRLTVSNNLLINFTGSGFSGEYSTYHGDDWVVHHNTIYGTAGAGISKDVNTAGCGLTVHSNIVMASAGVDVTGELTLNHNDSLKAADHNQWGTSFKLVMSRNSGHRDYTTLAAWQASTELEGGAHPGAGDLASDPLFVNGSGTLTQKADFALQAGSPCLGAGRDGTNMGCDVATVGVQS